jgi:hypothetical protein
MVTMMVRRPGLVQEVAMVLQEVDYSVDPMLMPPAAVVH